MNLTPVNYQTKLNENKPIMFGNNQKLIKHAVKPLTNSKEKVLLPAVGTVLATLGVAQKTSLKTQKEENSLDDKVANYIDRIKVSGNVDERKKIIDDLTKEPDSPEKAALWQALITSLVSEDVTNISQIYEKNLSEIITENDTKNATLETLNPNAELDDVFLENAFKRFTGKYELSTEEKEHCTELLKSNAGIVEKMMTYKNKDGSQMFSPESIGEFFYNNEFIIKNDPGKIFTTLEGETFNKIYADYENKAHALWRCLNY